MALRLVYATLLAFIPYLIAVWRAPRLKWPRWRWIIIAVAVIARLAMLPVPVILSGDVFRYLWDGKVQTAGFDPYRLAPNAPELAGLHDANWEKLDHRDVPTIYPPLLMLVFRAGKSVMHFKLIFTVFDLAALWLLIRLLRARGQNESLALIWGWNPLVILEFAGNAHAMSMAICFLVAGLWLWETNRRILAAAALAAAALSHLLAVPIAVAALLCRRDVKAWLVFAICAGVGMYQSAGMGLLHLAGRWRFNGSLFEVLVWLFGHEEPHQVSGVWVVYELPKRIAAVALAAVIAWTIVRRYRPASAAGTVAGAVLLLSSTVHPWYAIWLVALGCLELRVPWLAFSAFVVVSYVARIVELQTGVWVDAGFVRWMEYVPLFGLLLVDSLRCRR